MREQALDDLVAWIERRVRPDGDDVLTTDLATLARRWTPTADAATCHRAEYLAPCPTRVPPHGRTG